MSENINEKVNENVDNKSKYKYNFKNDAKSFVDDLYTIEDVKNAIYAVVLNRYKEDLIKKCIEKKLKQSKFGENIVTRDENSSDTWDLKYMLFFNIITGYAYLNLNDVEEDCGEYIKRMKIIKIEAFVYFRFNETFNDLVDRFYDAYLKCVGVYLQYLFAKFRNLKDLKDKDSDRWEYNNYKFVSVEDNMDGNEGKDDRDGKNMESNGE